MMVAGKNRFDVFKNKLSLVLSRLDALSPLNILARGYSVSRKLPQHKLLKSSKDILPGDRMETILADGSVVSFVEKVNKKRNDGV